MSGLGWENNGGSAGGGVTSLVLDGAGSEPALSGLTGDIILSIPNADGDKIGVVSTGTQYFGGTKNFTGIIGNNGGIVSNSGTQTTVNAYGTLVEPKATIASDAGVAVLDCRIANYFLYTPTESATINATNIFSSSGQAINLVIVTSGTSSYTVSFGTGFRAGLMPLATGLVSDVKFLVALYADGTEILEQTRTAAM